MDEISVYLVRIMCEVLSFMIGLVVSLKMWQGMENGLEDLPFWIAVSHLSVVYGLVETLILIPIYMRLKLQLLEEN